MSHRGHLNSMVVKNAGFTLLEILLVVLIVGILTAAGTSLLNNQSIERLIMSQAQQTATDLKFICEKAVLENQAFGIEWKQDGYQVLRYQQGSWLLVEQQPVAISTNISSKIWLDGYAQILHDSAENLPHIICQSDGSFNSFELRFSAAQSVNQNNSVYYALSNTSPWEMTGGWYQP